MQLIPLGTDAMISSRTESFCLVQLEASKHSIAAKPNRWVVRGRFFVGDAAGAVVQEITLKPGLGQPIAELPNGRQSFLRKDAPRSSRGSRLAHRFVGRPSATRGYRAYLQLEVSGGDTQRD